MKIEGDLVSQIEILDFYDISGQNWLHIISTLILVKLKVGSTLLRHEMM